MPLKQEDDALKQQLEKEASKQGNTTSLIKQVARSVAASMGSMPRLRCGQLR